MLTCGITHGEVFLVRGQGANRRELRVAFSPDDESADRIVPGGNWNILGYRKLATDADGVEWMMSTTSHGKQKVLIRSGQRNELTAATGMELRFRVVRDGDNCRANMAFISQLGPMRSGITLYRDGVRIPMKYRVVDAEGTVLASGGMAYG